MREEDSYSCLLALPPAATDPEHLAGEYLYSLQRAVAARSNDDADQFPAILIREDTPSRQAWLELVDATVAELKDDLLAKVVLARRSDFQLSLKLSVYDLVQRVSARLSRSYIFVYQPQPETAFVSGSPERLFRIRGRELASEAMAGTIRSGKATEEMDRLRDELLRCNKNRTEQGFVIQSVSESLESLCDRLDVAVEPEVVRLPTVQHLRTNIMGRLNDRVSLYDVIDALHPTPAVGGVPRRQALRYIRQVEPIDRGWYAGAVGCIGRHESEFAVGIRSALIDRDRMSLFAGAGIVSESEPNAEWDELEHKTATLLNLFARSSE
jgi:menaquinone-specific isochorismate synthase